MHIPRPQMFSTSGSGRGTPARHRVVRSILALALVVSSLMLAAPNATPAYAAGGTYYVAKTGSDTTGDGSVSRPWATIQKAANSMSGGDTVHVAPGTYAERVTIASSKSGTASVQTRFIADGRVVISKGLALQSSYTVLSGFEVTPGDTALSSSLGQVHVTGDRNTITNLSVHNTTAGKSAVMFAAGAEYNVLDGFQIKDVVGSGVHFYRGYHQLPSASTASLHNVARNGSIIHWTGISGVYLDGQYNLMEGLTIIGGPNGSTSGSGDGDGVDVVGPDNTIRGCTIYIWQWVPTSYAHSDCIQWYVYDVDGLVIENSVIGTWQTNSGAYFPEGPMQVFMTGTEAGGTPGLLEARGKTSASVTIRNSVMMGNPMARVNNIPVAFNFNTGSQTYTDYYLYNNTFWDMALFTTNDGRYRLHAYNNVYGKALKMPTSRTYMSYEGDYNFHTEAPVWNGREATFGAERPAAGGHSIMPTSGTLSPRFTKPDKSSASNYGISADLSPATGSPLIGAGVGSSLKSGVPTYDANRQTRSTQRTDIGAFVAGSGPFKALSTGGTVTTPTDGTVTTPTDGGTTTGTETPAPTDTTTKKPAPVHRFYNKTNGSHFYTASTTEVDTVSTQLATTYAYEGVAYTVNTANPENNDPLYRFYNRSNGSHFYTVSAAERDAVIAKYSSNYTYEGVAYNVSATNAGTPVYRFYNNGVGSHFYTTSAAERDSVRAKYSATYSYEGVAFWVAQ